MRMPRLSRTPGRIARFGRAREGSTAIEFALVAGPFFLLIGAILEVGIMLFAEDTLQNAVQEAGRALRTGQASSGGMTSAQFGQAVCNEAPNLQDCAARIGVFVGSAARFADLNVPGVAAIGPGTRAFAPGTGGQAVAIVATYDWSFSFPFMQPFSTVPGANARRLQGIAIFMNEPF
jgi:Flp pilus assembly protein TadG